MSLTSLTIALTFVALIVYKTIQIFKLALDQDLRHIPGPWFACYTHWVLKYHVLIGHRTAYIDLLHKKYGPLVRIAPNEVDAADIASYQEVHRIGTSFCKSPWYQGNSPNIISDDKSSMFEVQSNKRHTQLRKLEAPLWTPAAMARWEPLVRSKAELAVSKIREDADAGLADIYKWWLFYTFDIITEFSFGQSFNQLNQNERSEFLVDIERAFMIGGINNELPLLWPFLQFLSTFIPRLKYIAGCFKRLFVDYGEIAVQNARKMMLEDYAGPKTIFTHKIQNAESGESAVTTVEAIRNQAVGLTFAGTHTSAVTLTYLVWEVLRNPAVYLKLLETIQPYADDTPYSELAKIQYIEDVIQETMRLWPAAPGSLPRRATVDTVLSGRKIPAGTIVDTQALSFHHNPEYFSDPLQFKPERWVYPTQKMKQAFVAWGGGARSCIGMHLAKMEMVIAVFVFFKQCPSAKAVSTAADMEGVDYFLIHPKAEKCFITVV